MAGHQTGHPVRPWMREAADRRARARELLRRGPDFASLETIQHWLSPGTSIMVWMEDREGGPLVFARAAGGNASPIIGHGRSASEALNHLAREIDPAQRRV